MTKTIALLFNLLHYSRAEEIQRILCKEQLDNKYFKGFAGHMWSLLHILLCVLTPYKNVKSILSPRTVSSGLGQMMPLGYSLLLLTVVLFILSNP